MDQKSGKPSQKRRAILQGSLAAPVVLTLSSPAAAITSSERTLANLKDMQPAKTKYFQDSPDNWFRRPVTVVKMKDKSKDHKFAASGFVREDEWFYLDPIKNQYVKTRDMEWMTATSLANWNATNETRTQYLLVWIDPKDGGQTLKMVAEPSGGLIAATCSAIQSVTPGACPTGGRV